MYVVDCVHIEINSRINSRCEKINVNFEEEKKHRNVHFERKLGHCFYWIN